MMSVKSLEKFEPTPPCMESMQRMFMYLWLNEEGKEKHSFSFNIPHTLIIKHCCIEQWFYSDKERTHFS